MSALHWHVEQFRGMDVRSPWFHTASGAATYAQKKADEWFSEPVPSGWTLPFIRVVEVCND